MANTANMLVVPSRAAKQVINATIYLRSFPTNWSELIWGTGIGGDLMIINAGLYPKRYIPQPFSSAGIQNPTVWGTFTFGPGYVDHAYSVEWFIENITQPVVFTLESGDLPPGLHLFNIGATARGRISGTPTEAGTFTFTLMATGPDVTAPKIFTIVITQDPRRGTAYVGGN